jgi:hypothetical protein
MVLFDKGGKTFMDRRCSRGGLKGIAFFGGLVPTSYIGEVLISPIDPECIVGEES